MNTENVLDVLPFFARIKESKNIILAGAGGGYDIFCGIPLYFFLKAQNKSVTLANLTFSNLYGVEGKELTPHIIEVTADCGGSVHYFPEKHLCQWFQNRGEEQSIWCIHRTGARPIIEAYRALAEQTEADTVILVDGGTDSLMRGDECGLGTPQEDMASIAAVDELDVSRKMLASVGFGVDAYHGVCHAHFLESVAAIDKQGGHLGTFSLLSSMKEVELYKQACEFVFEKIPDHPSIVSSSILSAIDGEYGDFHATDRTHGSKLWINPLMALMWTFDLDTVARRCLYLDQIKDTQSYAELGRAILLFRGGLKEFRDYESIPV